MTTPLMTSMAWGQYNCKDLSKVEVLSKIFKYKYIIACNKHQLFKSITTLSTVEDKESTPRTSLASFTRDGYFQ